MAHAVWMQTLAGQRWTNGLSTLALASQDVAYAEPGQRLAAVINKQRGTGVNGKIPVGTKATENLGRLRPEGTNAHLSAFTRQSNLEGLDQLAVTDPQIDDLLHARAGVEHRGQLSKAYWQKANELAHSIEHIELSTRLDFNEYFVESLNFPEENLW